jgi:hypothetical protein
MTCAAPRVPICYFTGYMEKQGSTPIGKHAPVDLIGNTPLASLSGSTWNNEQTQLVRSMLADGDRFGQAPRLGTCCHIS